MYPYLNPSPAWETRGCLNCKKSFRVPRYKLDAGGGKFCSQQCYRESRSRLYSEPLDVRLWRKVDKSGDCWLWTGVINPRGYGYISEGGRLKSDLRVHRAAWIVINGPIPEGLYVCHRCDNRLCVNPDHLFLGTASDNSQDMANKGRSIKGRKMKPEDIPTGDRHGSKTKPDSTPRGERHSAAKLTDSQVEAIRQKYAAGGITQKSLCQEYGISPGHMSQIISRQLRKSS